MTYGGKIFVHTPLLAVFLHTFFITDYSKTCDVTVYFIVCLWNDQCFVRMSCLCWLLDGVVLYLRNTQMQRENENSFTLFKSFIMQGTCITNSS